MSPSNAQKYQYHQDKIRINIKYFLIVFFLYFWCFFYYYVSNPDTKTLFGKKNMSPLYQVRKSSIVWVRVQYTSIGISSILTEWYLL